jgi:hypothetical protein
LSSVATLTHFIGFAVDWGWQSAQGSWEKLAHYFCAELPASLKAQKPATAEQALLAALSSLPVPLTSVLTMYTHDLNRRLAVAAPLIPQHAHAQQVQGDAASVAALAASLDSANGAAGEHKRAARVPCSHSHGGSRTHMESHLHGVRAHSRPTALRTAPGSAGAAGAVAAGGSAPVASPDGASSLSAAALPVAALTAAASPLALLPETGLFKALARAAGGVAGGFAGPFVQQRQRRAYNLSGALSKVTNLCHVFCLISS